MSLNFKGEGPEAAKAFATAAKWEAISSAAQMLGFLALVGFIVHTCAGMP